MLRQLKLFTAIIIFASFFGCKTAQIQTEKPAEAYQSFVFKPKPSTINLPVEMDINNIETMLNAKLQGLIYENAAMKDADGVNLSVKAWKKDNFKLGLNNNELSYRIPLKLWIKTCPQTHVLGFSLSAGCQELNAEIALKYHTQFSINKDWSISTTTTSDGYEWISSPVLKIGPVNLNIKFVADLILKANKNKINTEIDKAISKNLDVKHYAQQAWDMMQSPMQVSEQYNVWLKITPQELSTLPLSGKNGKIHHNIGIKALTECYVGKEPPTDSSSTLPNLKIVNKLDEGFSINLMSDIPFTTVDSLAKQFLVGKTFTSGKRAITINDMKLYANNDNMVVEATVSGSIKGKLYFMGKPYYDAEKSAIAIRNLDFELKTKNALLKTADWIAHGTIAKMIGEKMVFPLKDNIDQIKQQIQQNITNKEVVDNVIINGNLDDITIDEILMTPESIKLPIIFKGKLSVNLLNNKK